jgi:hypothetical protein
VLGLQHDVPDARTRVVLTPVLGAPSKRMRLRIDAQRTAVR